LAFQLNSASITLSYAVMTTSTPLIEELRLLPSDRLEDTAAMIDALLAERRAKRDAMISATSGSLAGPVGEALEAALADCEVIHEA
jgi:hypothetical protein